MAHWVLITSGTSSTGWVTAIKRLLLYQELIRLVSDAGTLKVPRTSPCSFGAVDGLQDGAMRTEVVSMG
jgi:hypothetical protein